jgi:RNA polymerase sigma factor (sigma-70 family)
VSGAVEDAVAPPVSFEAAFPTLYRAAYRAAYRILGSREDAEEVAQETLARCLVRWRRVAPYAEAWSSRSAANLAIDVYRRRSRRSVVERPDGDDPGQRTVELRADLVAALQSLSRRQRDVVVLRYLVELPERDVAQVLGCSTGSVKRHASRGLAALRARMGASGFEVGDAADQVAGGTAEGAADDDRPAGGGERRGEMRTDDPVEETGPRWGETAP